MFYFKADGECEKKSIVSELLWSLQRVWDYFFFFFFCKAKLSSVEIVIGIFLPMTLWYDMRKEQMFWQLMWTFGKISWLLSPVVSSWNLLWWHSKNVDLCLGPSMITYSCGLETKAKLLHNLFQEANISELA